MFENVFIKPKSKGNISISSVNSRIFVVGCPRSGTTLLQSLLAGHSDVFSFPESHFFNHLVPYATWRKYLGLARPGIEKHLNKFCKKAGIKKDFSLGESVIPVRIKKCVREFINLLDKRAKNKGVKTWVEKTPIHLHYISTIEYYIPDAKFVHVVRDGRDVVASMHKVTHEHPEVWGGRGALGSVWSDGLMISNAPGLTPKRLVIMWLGIVI